MFQSDKNIKKIYFNFNVRLKLFLCILIISSNKKGTSRFYCIRDLGNELVIFGAFIFYMKSVITKLTMEKMSFRIDLASPILIIKKLFTISLLFLNLCKIDL